MYRLQQLPRDIYLSIVNYGTENKVESGGGGGGGGGGSKAFL
jgi:hypothetical protein